MTTVTSARHDWEEGQRRFEAEARDTVRGAALHAQRDAVVDELRRRVGSTFTLAELAAAYVDSERWLAEVIEERAPSRGWARTASIAGDAAFHAYSRQALDYTP
jgi:hypothetical protein